jgi:hypothetical protein
VVRVKFDPIMAGAMAALRELKDLSAHAKRRLREHDRLIVQADLEELLRMLADAKGRIDAEVESELANRTMATLNGTKQVTN